MQWPRSEPIERGVLFGANYSGESVTDSSENMDCGAVQAVEGVVGTACAGAKDGYKGRLNIYGDSIYDDEDEYPYAPWLGSNCVDTGFMFIRPKVGIPIVLLCTCYHTAISPMASLVLTDSSQLTSESQHLDDAVVMTEKESDLKNALSRLSVVTDRMDLRINVSIIKSCRACRLNRLPEVKAFIFGDVPSYENVVFKPIPGASPELILLDENEKELERLDLAPLNREECNSLLSKYGFQKKGSDVESNRIRDDF
uniref:Selenoprotein M n=1 Tax=Timema shepardi TaxID=629360 RepID=A0A7R9ATJ8_TIMSH|nr:unnamed protein product [Timema shepardi]